MKAIARPSALLRLSLATSFAAFMAVAAPPDFDRAHRETVTNLQRFVQIDTSNPPGNETKGALFLKSLLEGEGIPAEIVERVPGRGNLIARLKGSDAILCDASNLRISDRLLARWGWTPHAASLGRRMSSSSPCPASVLRRPPSSPQHSSSGGG